MDTAFIYTLKVLANIAPSVYYIHIYSSNVLYKIMHGYALL